MAIRKDIEIAIKDLGTTTWMKRAACKGMDANLFFPEADEHRQFVYVDAVKQVCRKCPVKKECYKFAQDNYQEGWWAGTTGQERLRHRREVRAGTRKPW